MKKPKTLLVFLFLLFIPKLFSQELLLDIRPGYESSGPSNFCSNNGLLFFTAMDGNIYGECELWKSDGTTQGTVMVKDINPTAGAIKGHHGVIVMNGNIYFTANDGITGQELWKSDGTEQGTVLVKDINAGSQGYVIWNLCVMNNSVYFSADDAVHGRELWKTDGTSAGTVMVKDILPGQYEGFTDTQSKFGVLDDYLYFSARDATNVSSQLWRTNGTEGGTTKVSDIQIEKNKILKEFKGKLYFSGCDNCDLTSEELCVTDGTQEGTHVLKDINKTYNGKGRSAPTMLIEFDGNLYFLAGDGNTGEELWKTDGTEAGTQLLKDINPGSIGSSPQNLTIYNNRLYFTAYDPVNGPRLWSTDGTEAGTTLVDTNVLADGTIGLFDNKLYFAASDGVLGTELWETNGTADGTKLVKDIQPAGITIGASSFPSSFYNHDNKMLYFLADNGRTGKELWKLDGKELSVSSFEKKKFAVYPNPSSAKLNLVLYNNEDINKITITDLAGKKVKELKGNHSQIDIENLSNGLYVLEVSTSNAKFSNKFIKK